MSIIICRCGSWLRTPEDAGSLLKRCPSCGRSIGLDGKIAVEPQAEEDRPSRGFWRLRPSPYPKRGQALSLADALVFPISDAPGLALLFLVPPFLMIMSVPVFDVLLFFRSGPRGGFNPLALLVLPVALPLILSFMMTFGYVLLYLGRILTDAAMGRRAHPRYPLWDRFLIFEGLVRWFWAVLLGIVIAGGPLLLYAKIRGQFEPVDWAVAALLLAISVGAVQLGLAASILHDSITMVHPVTIARAISRLGPEIIQPWIITSSAIILGAAVGFFALYRPPSLAVAAISLWAAWVFWIYEAMVVMHALGWACFRNSLALGWFGREPKWGAWDRPGRIYTNS